MNEGDASWSLGVLIGLPLVALGVVSFAVISFLGFRWLSRNRGSYDTLPGWLFGLGGLACAVVLLVGAAIGYYPWKAEYHQYVTKTGEVESISSRILGSSESFQQKFVTRFTDGREFGCTDTRCTLIKPGDTLILGCKRVWQYNGTDGYDCNFIATGRPKA